MVMLNNKFWKISDEKLLKEKYATTPMSELVILLNRSEQSIYSRANDLKLKKDDSGYTTAEKKFFRIISVLQHLMHSKTTIPALSKRIGISERTLYRYIKLFDSLGITVTRDLNREFHIADKCPLCNQQHTTK